MTLQVMGVVDAVVQFRKTVDVVYNELLEEIARQEVWGSGG
jgi:hypothetical protein